MGTELDDRLAELARAWDAAAPPVGAAEAHSRVTELPGVAAAPHLARRHRWPVFAGALAVAAAAVALVAVVRDDPSPSVGPNTSESSTAVSTTVPATSVASTVPSTTISVDDQLADVAVSVTAALSTFDSFRATATLHRISNGIPADPTVTVLVDETTSVNTITLFADGSMWSEGDQFLWTAYDATTGVSRAAFRGMDGATAYQEVVGWTDNSTPLLMMLGSMPVMQFDGLFDPTVEEVTSHLGRPAWRITSTLGFGAGGSLDPASDGYSEQTDAYTVDQQTGLLVAFRSTNTHDGVEDLTEMRLDDLETDVQMPVDFPGVFPEGAVVDRSGDPNGFVPLTIEQAAAQFGFGFVAPVLDDERPRVWLAEQGRVFADNGSQLATMRRATIEWYDGFARSSIEISVSVAVAGSALPEGFVLIDGLLCRSLDGEHCVGFGQPSEITAGALAGAPSSFEGSWLTISNGPVQVVINAPSPEAALAIANSLTTVEF
jgi:hypothetical protein